MAYQFSDSVKNLINHFFSNCVVTTSIVVSGILFASYQLFWMKELSVGTSTNFIFNIKLLSSAAATAVAAAPPPFSLLVLFVIGRFHTRDG